jgi:hypothetical protein
MSVQIHAVHSTDSADQNGYSITPVISTRFTDWNDGMAVAENPENRRDDVLIDRPTMEMGNRTEVHHEKPGVRSPKGSYSKKGKSLYKRLDMHNRDTWWEYRRDNEMSSNVDADFKSSMLLAYASELGLHLLQKHKALKRFMQLDLPRATGRTELNGFVICVLVVNEDAEEFGSEKIYHPQRSPEKNDTQFQQFADALIDTFGKVTESTITRVLNKLSQGNPPTRNKKEWGGTVKRNSDAPRPSYAYDHYDPQADVD